MIIDSHTHLSHHLFENDKLKYFAITKDEYFYDYDAFCINPGNLEDIISAFGDLNIAACIEPGITLESNERILKLCEKHPETIFPAFGVHPTRCVGEKWGNRSKLKELLSNNKAYAIGETGLDFHRKVDRRLINIIKQFAWFFFHLKLAKEAQLPLILHVRGGFAHKAVLTILKYYKGLCGGVCHCYTADYKTAKKYVNLGYYIGIGGKLLQYKAPHELEEVVQSIPLDNILVETDCPYVKPFFDNPFSSKKKLKAVNTPLILPAVITRISDIKGNYDYEKTASVTTDNAIRLFNLPFKPHEIK